MPAQAPSRFQSWEFTEEENRSACTLNDLQKKKIQTIQCSVAEQLINLEASTKEGIAEAEIQRSFLKGQLTVLQHLLDTSAAMELQINDDRYEMEQVAAASSNPVGPNLYTHFRSQESESASQFNQQES